MRQVTYSVRKFLTGLLKATFIAWMLIVSNAMKNALAHDSTIIHTENGARYAKPCSQLLTKYHATGEYPAYAKCY